MERMLSQEGAILLQFKSFRMFSFILTGRVINTPGLCALKMNDFPVSFFLGHETVTRFATRLYIPIDVIKPPTGIEPETSSLPRTRSNHLSYRGKKFNT